MLRALESGGGEEGVLRIAVVCFECSDPATGSWYAPVTGNGVNVSRCPAGHVVNFMIQTPFYYLLFLRGLTDAARKDFREAVLNAYAAWDVFVARACNLLLAEDGAADAWKGLPGRLRRAEPLLALYAGLFAAKTRSLPKLVSTASQETRNLVIHGDYIPEEQEAINLAVDVLDCMRAFQVAFPEIIAKDEYGEAATARLAEAGRTHMEENPEGWKQMTTVGLAVHLDLDVRAEVESIRNERFPELVG